MITPLATLNSDKVLVRIYVSQPQQRSEIIWTAFFVRLVFGVLLTGLLVLSTVMQFIQHDTATERFVFLVLFLGLIACPFTLGRVIFEAEVLAKIAIWVANGIVIVSALTRIFMVWLDLSLESFAIVNVATTSVTSFAIFLAAIFTGYMPRFKWPSWKLCKTIILKCWPLCLSSLVTIAHFKIDIVMVRSIAGYEESGFYSIALRISEFIYFLPVAVTATFFPSLVASAQSLSNEKFRQYRYMFFQVITFLAYLCIVGGLLFSQWVIVGLYGKTYQPSVYIFMIHILSCIFVFQNNVKWMYLVQSGWLWTGFLMVFGGLIINVILNAMLIPHLGAIGAALASLVSYSFTGLWSSLLFAHTREMGQQQLRAILHPKFGVSE